MQTLQIKKHQHIIMCVMNGTKLSAISLNFVATQNVLLYKMAHMQFLYSSQVTLNIYSSVRLRKRVFSEILMTYDILILNMAVNFLCDTDMKGMTIWCMCS